MKVGPAITESVSSLAPGDKYRVLVDVIDLGKRLDQIRRITFVPAKPGPN
jgi:hypothetical protein